MSVSVGDKAPDFTMPTDGNGSVSLAKLRGMFEGTWNTFQARRRNPHGEQCILSQIAQDQDRRAAIDRVGHWSIPQTDQTDTDDGSWQCKKEERQCVDTSP